MRFLVDLGTLVPVTAVDGRDAFHMALSCVGGPEKVSGNEAVVYQLDAETLYPPIEAFPAHVEHEAKGEDAA